MTKAMIAVLALAACGSDGGGDDEPAGDAGPATVMSVTCDDTEAAEVETTGGFRFSPMAVTITAGEVVKFTNSSQHSVVPGSAPTDSGLKAGFSTSTCLKFTTAGTFNYRCDPHTSMKGTITVN